MFERIALPYAYDALEPYIDKLTVETHYEKHHKTYTDKFNDLMKRAPEAKDKCVHEILTHLDALPEDIRTGVRNNGGGFYNHNLYFESLTPKSGKPSGTLAKMLDNDFGGASEMLEKLNDAATVTLFGSGWAWLVLKGGKLAITTSPNQDLPSQKEKCSELLPLDMWEHAYYLKYKNDKKSYVQAFDKIVNWDVVSERLEKALHGSAVGAR